MKKKVVWFIDSVSEQLSRDLADLAEDNKSGVTEKFNFLCRKQDGQLGYVPRLWLVPETIKDRVYGQRSSHSFFIYRCEDDGLPEFFIECTWPVKSVKLKVIKASSLHRRHGRHLERMKRTIH